MVFSVSLYQSGSLEGVSCCASAFARRRHCGSAARRRRPERRPFLPSASRLRAGAAPPRRAILAVRGGDRDGWPERLRVWPLLDLMDLVRKPSSVINGGEGMTMVRCRGRLGLVQTTTISEGPHQQSCRCRRAPPARAVMTATAPCRRRKRASRGFRGGISVRGPSRKVRL